MNVSTNHETIIAQAIEESRKLFSDTGVFSQSLSKIAQLLANTIRSGNKILVFGNGGSAADAQHFAAELVGRFYTMERKALPVMALTTNTSTLTALSNDYGYDIVFSRQLEAFGEKGDVAIGISTSGNAQSVLRGFEQAKRQGMQTVFFTGKTGGKITQDVESFDATLMIPSENTGRIQEMHTTAIHIICSLVEYELFEKA